MKNKHLYLLNALFLSACADPTSSLDPANQEIDKTGYIFYQNSDLFDPITKLKMIDCYYNLWLTLYDEENNKYISFEGADKKISANNFEILSSTPSN